MSLVTAPLHLTGICTVAWHELPGKPLKNDRSSTSLLQLLKLQEKQHLEPVEADSMTAVLPEGHQA